MDMVDVSARYKKVGYAGIAIYVMSVALSAVLDMPIVASMGLLVVVFICLWGLWHMYRNSLPYPGSMGKMESWYGRGYVTVFFALAGFLWLLVALGTVYRDIRNIMS
jgi:hypothetical protein